MEKKLIEQIVTNNPEETIQLAEKIGRRVRGGEVIQLISDLGGGKTTFVRGLAKGMGSDELVHSPSFTLSNTYKAKGLWLYHFDFYRLEEPGILRNELDELIGDTKVVIVIEWANIVADVLPKDILNVTIQTIGDTVRNVRLSYPKSQEYLIDTIT
jgi:tRNA threonylcarbamoyladenosine biosynthesis protein TsaE